MTTKVPNCAQCRSAMERGFRLDRGHGGAAGVGQWVEGEPEKSVWTGVKMKGRRVRAVVSFRCPQCGLLIDFAVDEVKV